MGTSGRWFTPAVVGLLLAFAWATGVLRPGQTPPNHEPTPLVFVQYGGLASHNAFTFLFARYSNPRTSIHLLRYLVDGPADDDSSTQWPVLFHKLGILVTNVTEELHAHTVLREKYVHSSSNPSNYEQFCLIRFAVALQYAVRNSLQNFIMTDLDIVVFEDAQRLPEEEDWMLTGTGATFFSRWSSHRLAAFSLFINFFYNRQADQVCQDISSWGDTLVPGSAEYGKVKSHMASSCPPDTPPTQFSDMHMLCAFQANYHLTKVATLETTLPNQIASDAHYAGPDVCSSAEDFYNVFQWVGNANKRLALASGQEIWGLHMQGGCKSIACKAFCPGLRAEDVKLVGCCRQ